MTVLGPNNWQNAGAAIGWERQDVQGGGGDEEFGLGVLSGDVKRAGGCVSLQFRAETGHINVGDTSVWMTLRGLDHQRGEYRGICKT